MTKRNHEINSRPGAGHSAFPDRAQLSASATTKTAPAGVMVYKVAAAALTGSIDIAVHRAVYVIDAWAIAVGGAGGAGDTITVSNDTTAISDAMDLQIADNTIARAATLDDAQRLIAAGSNLRVTGASAVTADVYVLVAPITE